MCYFKKKIMKGNSVQHRRKLGFHFAFRFASVDARITVDVSGMLSFSDQLSFSCRFFLYHFLFFTSSCRKNASFLFDC